MCFEVADDFAPGLQLNHIRNIEFVEQLLYQVDVIASRLTVVAFEGIRPQIQRILIDQGILFGINPVAIRLCGYAKGAYQQTKN